MSYDIILAAAELSGTFLAEDPETQERGEATFSRIESRVRENLGEPVGVWRPPIPGGASFGELSVADTGLQLVFTREGAEVSFPTLQHEDQAGIEDQARDLIRIVQEETGWQAYDVQTDQDFDGQFHRDIQQDTLVDPLAVGHPTSNPMPYRATDQPDAAALPPFVKSGQVPGHTSPAAPRVNDAASTALLKNLKRRAITTFVLAAVIIGFAMWDFATNSVGWFTWVLMVVGAVNLMMGVMVVARTKGFTDPGPLQ